MASFKRGNLNEKN